MKIILASHNAGKIKELQVLLKFTAMLVW